MRKYKASVIIPTRNRPGKLTVTLSALAQQQTEESFEVVVVDDGSTPPVVVNKSKGGPEITVVRTEGIERSAARNSGAERAKGGVLIFIDDDISVKPDFVRAHLQAHSEFPQVLAVGAIHLPEELMKKPFPRFRQSLEQREVPRARSVTSSRNFCTAANMSMPRDLFHKLGGFDSSIASSEDQDLALRHTDRGGQILFIPEAMAVHRDDALDIRSYCKRAEWGSLHRMPFCERYPDWPDNIDHALVNGPLRVGREPAAQSIRKIVKASIRVRPFLELLFFFASMLERVAPESGALDRVYRLLLGIHIFRGYREGIKRSAVSAQRSAIASQRPEIRDRNSMIAEGARRTGS